MKSLGKITYKIFLAVFFLFPLLPATIMGTHLSVQMQYKKFTVIVFLLCLAAFYCIYLNFEKNAKIDYRNNLGKTKIILSIFLFLISILVKYFILTVMGDNVYQNSEYGCVLRISTGTETINDLRHISVFPHWSLVGFLHRIIMKVFEQNSIEFIQLINAVVLSVAVVIIFYISCEVTQSISSALMAGILFALAPTENLYFLMLSNEFIAIMAFVTITYVIIKNSFFILYPYKKRISEIFLIGIGVGINFFLLKYSKPIGITFFVAIIICIVLIKFISKKIYLREFVKISIVMVFTFFMLSSVYVRGLSAYTNYPINPNTKAHFLFIGLYSDYQNVGNVYEKKMTEKNFNYDAVNKEYMNIIKKDVVENISELPIKLKENFKIQWQDYKNGLKMVLYEYNTENPYLFNIEGLALWGGIITHYFYILILVFSLISILKKLLTDKLYNISYFFICLLCFGVALGLVFGESQERYKCIIMPLLYLLAGDGIIQTFKIGNYLIDKVKCIKKFKEQNFISYGRR